MKVEKSPTHCFRSHCLYRSFQETRTFVFIRVHTRAERKLDGTREVPYIHCTRKNFIDTIF